MMLMIEYGVIAFVVVVAASLGGFFLSHDKKPKRPAHEVFDEYE